MLKPFARKVLPSSLWTALRLARQRWSIARFRQRDVTHMYGGHQLVVHLADPLARGWYDHDWGEPAEITFLKAHGLVPGARVFDLGGHQGVVALMLAKTVGTSGHVLAVEASAHNAAVANRNRELNDASQLTVLHAAVSNRSGTVTMNEGLNSAVDDGSGQWGTVRVAAVTIDELAERHGRPDVVYLDIEGFEATALAGAETTLATSADWFVEVHVPLLARYGVTAYDVVAHFPESRFNLFFAGEMSPHFVPLGRHTKLPEERFYLIAVANKS